jgi:hypothetical protein
LADTTVTPTTNLGFLTVLHEPSGYLGGYLVTNLWGRPLEFRLSTAVQPNRVQQILYAGTLQSYICGDLIGKTLVEKTTAPVQMVFTDAEAALDLRLSLQVPVVWVLPSERGSGAPLADGTARGVRASVRTHARFPQDENAVREVLERSQGLVDLSEPFTRIREAISEARKLGVANRAS